METPEQPFQPTEHLLGNSTSMKKQLLFNLAIAAIVNGLILGLMGQAKAQTIESLPSFSKIVASPHINVVLQKGDAESIQLVYHGVDADKMNVEVQGSKLHLFLDHAKIVERQKRFDGPGYSYTKGIYQDASVTAYVTYRQLESVEMRGETELYSEGQIESDKFKLKVYGETEVNLASLRARKFKASVYGANKIKIRDGETGDQLLRVFGENNIDAAGLASNTTTTRIYGEGLIKVLASEECRVTAFGEPELQIRGGGRISKGIIIGEANISTRR